MVIDARQGVAMRLFRLLLVSALAVTTLTACSPPPEPILALGVRDGKPIGVVVPCGTTAIVDVAVHEPDPPAGASYTPAPRWSVVTGALAGPTEVPLLGDVPDGWQVSDDRIERFESGTSYSLGALSRRHAFPVTFTLADLDRLDADHVLAGVSYQRSEIATREAFERKGTKSCPRS
jgi:hypothetical protein